MKCFATVPLLIMGLAATLVKGGHHTSTSQCVNHPAPTAVPPRPKGGCFYRKLHKKDWEAPPDAGDTVRWWWHIVGNELWRVFKNDPNYQIAIRLQEELAKCTPFAGFQSSAIAEHWGASKQYSDVIWNATFFTEHHDSDDASEKKCISRVLSGLLHGEMKTKPCEGISDEKLLKCYEIDPEDGLLRVKKEYRHGSKGNQCNAGFSMTCGKKRLQDPLLTQHAGIECEHAHGLTLEQIRDHNHVYETTVVPDPCPSTAAPRPTGFVTMVKGK
nr:hypothetical protein B0A51_09268 [Rachicladosporium sp. CCFEE 5018]